MEKLAATEHGLGCGRVEARVCSKFDSNEDTEDESDNSLSSAATRISFKPDISIKPHEFSGAYVACGKNKVMQLVTRCSGSPNDYSDAETFLAEFNGECCQFRTWSPHLAKYAAALLKGVDLLQIYEGSKVMYLGTAISCSVAHLSDIVGEPGIVYAIETSAWAKDELVELAGQRDNVVAIIEDATMPYKYRRLVLDSVDLIFCDTLQHEQLRILILHARHYLRAGGHFSIMLPGGPADNVDSVNRLHAEHLETVEQISLEPYIYGQFMAAGIYNRIIDR